MWWHAPSHPRPPPREGVGLLRASRASVSSTGARAVAPKKITKGDRMAIEFREHHDRLQAATKKLDGTLAQLRARVCPADAVGLSEDGSCGVCGRTFTPPSVDLSSMTPQQRKTAIESGIVPANTAGLSDQESRNAAFWQGYGAKHRDGRQARPLRPSLTEKGGKCFRPGVR